MGGGMTATTNAPIIIKRKKVVAGGGHHGGAWKVAYADFVTAMMAFFMLMWLLNATTEQQRKGIADYFSPSIPIAKVSGGGAGALGGSNPTLDSRAEFDGEGSAPFERGTPIRTKGGADVAAVEALQEAERELLGRGGESLISEQALRHVISRVTDEGLVIELFDHESRQLFKPGTNQPTPLLIEIAQTMAQAINDLPNKVAIHAYTRTAPLAQPQGRSWPLSMERADMFRRLLDAGGLEAGRIKRTTGFGDSAPVSSRPLSVRNNRIELILLLD